jgi:hypothetical protein
VVYQKVAGPFRSPRFLILIEILFLYLILIGILVWLRAELVPTSIGE